MEKFEKNNSLDVERFTMLKDVDVPEQLRHKVKTDIDWFDDVLGGEGLTPSSVSMFYAPSGFGKTTFLLQVADALSKKCVVLLNTTEQSIHQVKLTSERLGLNGDFLMGDEKTVDDLLEYSNIIKGFNKGKQLVVIHDSIQAIASHRGVSNLTTADNLRSADRLKDYAKETFTIMIFICQVTKSGNFTGANAMKHLVDTSIRGYVDTQKSSETFGKKIVTVDKNRYGCNGKSFIVELENNGLAAKGYLEL